MPPRRGSQRIQPEVRTWLKGKPRLPGLGEGATRQGHRAGGRSRGGGPGEVRPLFSCIRSFALSFGSLHKHTASVRSELREETRIQTALISGHQCRGFTLPVVRTGRAVSEGPYYDVMLQHHCWLRVPLSLKLRGPQGCQQNLWARRLSRAVGQAR